MPSAERRDGVPHHDHIYLSSNLWDGLWIIQQPISREIAREERVLYVERFVSLWTVVRYPALWRRLFAWLRGPVRREENLWLLAPLPLIHLGHRFPKLFALEMRVQRRWILRAARKLGFHRRRILWADHPIYEPAIGRLGESLAIYHVGDEVSAFSSSHAPTMQSLEQRMLRAVDCVFAAAEQLANDKRALNDETHTVWNGIDARLFDAPDESDPLPTIAVPRVTFVGVIESWVNVELLELLAERLPSAQLLIIGPHAALPSSFQRRPNVHVLGRKPREEIPAILRNSCASIIPFRRSLLTRRLVPLKLFEALAAGIMPVATDFSPDLERLAAAGLVRVARSDEEFVDQVRQAIAADSPALRTRLREFGMRQTWDARWTEMRKVITELSLQATDTVRPVHSEGAVTMT
jgi:glycosyltransferase involved in cell wall biosynthesis